jgi:hypothetical protein
LQADSVNLWTTIVSNKLLANTNIILFLNKIDIMKSKLVRPSIRFHCAPIAPPFF